MGVKAVLITGASSGIGRATALCLENAGWLVFAGVRDPAAGESLVQAAKGAGAIEPIELDITDPGSISAAKSQLTDRIGSDGLGGVVNNAGIGVGGVLEYVDLDDFRRVLEVNVTGQVAVTQAMLPLLRRGRGRIAFISSDNGRWAPPFMAPYAASKFAIEGVGDALRFELRQSKIDVAIIEPGSIKSSIWDKGLRDLDELDLPDESRSIYGDVPAVLRGALEQGQRDAIPAARVANAVHHALTARRPKTRYRVGRDAQMMVTLRAALPDRAFDYAISKVVSRLEKSGQR